MPRKPRRILRKREKSGPTSSRPVALLAGATGGLGGAIARRLAASGFDLVLCHRSRSAEARALALDVLELGARALVCQGDLLDAAHVKRILSIATREFGGIDALILSVGELHLGPPSRTTVADLGRQMRSNLHAPWSLALAALPLLARSRQATILFFGMAGVSNLTAKRQVSAHAASKAALLVMARSLARELAPRGIAVLTIAPGVVKTHRSTRASVEPFRKSVPSGVVNTPEDVAAVVEFALSPAARPLTGSELPVANGFGL